jgi:alkylphosphonate utilization operon protein PhnA
MVLASLFFIYRMSDLTRVERRPLREEASEPQFLYPDGSMRVAAWQLFGSLFFGAVNKLEALLDPAAGHPEVVILDMTQLIQLDTTGLEGLENLLDKLKKRGCTLIVCGLNSQPGSLLYRSGFIDHLGDDNVKVNIMSALPNCPKCKSEYTYEDGSMYVCPECAHEWSAQAGVESTDQAKIWKDANGNVLQDGDTITVIKDLKIKGSSSVVKVGTKVKKHPSGRGATMTSTARLTALARCSSSRNSSRKSEPSLRHDLKRLRASRTWQFR